MEANLLALEGRARESWARVQEMLAGKDALEGRPGMVAALMDTGVLAALTLGDLAGAERCAEAGHRLHGGFGQWNDVIVRFGARRAQVLRLRGRVAEAAARCRDIAARLPSPSVFAGPWLGELAHAQALLGEAEKAEETLAAAGDAALPVGPAVVLPLESARVWTLAARGDVAGAVEAALAAAEGAPRRTRCSCCTTPYGSAARTWWPAGWPGWASRARWRRCSPGTPPPATRPASTRSPGTSRGSA
nr:hypothetical protein GCM10020093_115740 [Planobispora longispora]